MGKTPAVIFIARHGARLDAADQQWHLTSATPYDPPLSYGGWNQSRALGARIISLLRAREDIQEDDETDPVVTATSTSTAANGGVSSGEVSPLASTHGGDSSSHDLSLKPTKPRRKRKHKIIIHSSPFLRCLQTAVALSAGISQHYHSSDTAPQPLRSSSLPVNTRIVATTAPSLPSTQEKGEASAANLTLNMDTHHHPSAIRATPSKTTHSSDQGPHRCLLRVDAFLGEWLSPDYFDQITPPPSSARMVDAAKAELLRRGEAIAATADRSGRPAAATGFFPGGWGSNPTSPDAEDEGAFRNMSAMAYALGERSRAGSHDAHTNAVSNPRTKGFLTKINTDLEAVHEDGYIPPTPSYAVSSSDAIPAGYVAHARDACVQVDYQWDSTYAPQNWGDGGEFGEEWTSMHLRFRLGLQRMVDWYRTQDQPARARRPEVHREVNGHALKKVDEDETEDQDDDDDDDSTDTVLVLVTHGAGCNALIGALTGQPVLLDVGMASLTMAELKDPRRRPPETEGQADSTAAAASGTTTSTDGSPASRRKRSIDLSITQNYELKLIASADHLRAGVNPTQLPSTATASTTSSSPSSTAAPLIPSYRHRFMPRSSMSTDQFMIGPSIPHTPSARAWSLNARPSSAPRGTPGLWGSISAISDDTLEPTDDELVPDFGDPTPRASVSASVSASAAASTSGPQDGAEVSASNGADSHVPPTEPTFQPPKPPQLPQRTLSQGLWGSAPPLAKRDATTKRRWTVTERRP